MAPSRTLSQPMRGEARESRRQQGLLPRQPCSPGPHHLSLHLRRETLALGWGTAPAPAAGNTLAFLDCTCLATAGIEMKVATLRNATKFFLITCHLEIREQAMPLACQAGALLRWAAAGARPSTLLPMQEEQQQQQSGWLSPLASPPPQATDGKRCLGNTPPPGSHRL